VNESENGEGGGHSVVSEDVPAGGAELRSESIISGEGHTYEETLDVTGVYRYYCNPHYSKGMYGAIIVSESGGNGGGNGGR
jgi:plastocyanin